MSEPKIPKGYKKTEVGVIPEEWEAQRIDNNAVIQTGSRNTQDNYEDGTYPFFVRSQHVERINTYTFDTEAVLTAGDGVGTGKVIHYIIGKFDVHQRVYCISEFSDRLSGKYFFYQFGSLLYDRVMSMTAKSSVDSVRMEMIAGMKVPLPPLPEQRAIAEALSDVDSLLSSLDKLIEKKRVIKQGAMQELLMGRKRLPGFNGKWEQKKLGELGSFYKGQGIKKDQAQSSGIPCIRYGEIYTHHNDIVRNYNSYISREVAITSYRLVTGDLLFAGSGETAEEIGKCIAFISSDECYAGGDIVILRPLRQNSEYLAYLINSPSVNEQKSRLGQGDAIVHISAKNLSSIELLLPPLPEQTAIATILSDMDADIEALERRRDKTKAIKQGMMQELLTGRIRLV